jgi:hypothetical protein
MAQKYTDEAFKLFKKWKHLFTVKIGISIFAMIVFFLAESQHSSKVDMKLSLKK